MKNFQRAGYPFLYAATSEEDRLIREQRAKIDPDVVFYKWDIVAGLRVFINPNGDEGAWIWKRVEESVQYDEDEPDSEPQLLTDPQEALKFITQLPVPSSEKDGTIIFMCDYHKFFEDISVIREALNLKDHLKNNGKMVVFLSAITNIPIELADDIQKYNFPMPSAEAHRQTLKDIAEVVGLPMPEDATAIQDALRGLTRDGAENCLAKSVVDDGKFGIPTIITHKASKLAADGVLQFATFKENLDDIFGYEVALEWMLETSSSPLSKATLLYGVPGCAKTLLAKVVSNVMKRAMVTANFGRLKDPLQGNAEAKTDQMFKQIYALGNPYVFCDEYDKTLSGTEAADVDGGTSQMIFQQLLINLEDQEPGGPHWIFTVNSLKDVVAMAGGAFLSRMDIVFFFDLPGVKECEGISRIWNRKYGVDIPIDYDFWGFSGRDIAKLARIMKMKNVGVDEARKLMIPTLEANKKQVESIRQAAKKICIWASKEQETDGPAPKRRVIV